MITINGKIYRNLQEQVGKNQEDIEDLQTATSDLDDIRGNITTLQGNVQSLQTNVTALQNKHIHVISIYSETYKYSIQFVVKSSKSTAYEDLTEIYEDIGNATIPAAGLCSMGILNEKVHSLTFEANGVQANEIAMDGSDSGTTDIQSDNLIDYVI